MTKEIGETYGNAEDDDTAFSRFNRLSRLLHGLDERGLVLSLAAFAEEALGDLIKAFLIAVPAADALLEGFNAPLGTFSARIKMAFALGLITREQFEDLERLRKIRNEFSHNWEQISFGDPKILTHINALHYNWVDDKFPDTPMKKVRSSLVFLLTEVVVAASQIAKKDLRLKISGSRLISGLTGAFDDQVAECERKFTSLKSELDTATGEHRNFLLLRWDAWLGKLDLVWIAAPAERRNEIDRLRTFYKQGKPT